MFKILWLFSLPGMEKRTYEKNEYRAEPARLHESFKLNLRIRHSTI